VGATLTDALPPGPALQQRDLHLRRRFTSGGDDYELCFTAPARQREAVLKAAQSAGTTVTRIGQIDAQPACGCSMPPVNRRTRRIPSIISVHEPPALPPPPSAAPQRKPTPHFMLAHPAHWIAQGFGSAARPSCRARPEPSCVAVLCGAVHALAACLHGSELAGDHCGRLHHRHLGLPPHGQALNSPDDGSMVWERSSPSGWCWCWSRRPA
jgi:hypothetical protein